jgi:nucleotide-binding universal stress UspA family protein
MVIHHERTKRERVLDMYNKILVAFDGSAPSIRALQHASKLAESVNANKLTIVHIKERIHLQQPVFSVDLDALIEEENRDILSEAHNHLTQSGIPYEAYGVEGTASKKIIEYARDNQQDVIVIGSRGKGFVKETFLGSVSHEVAQSAECPVIIVK